MWQMRREKKNFSNDIAEIGRLKKKKNLNCGKSNATAPCYFIIFLQIVVMANFLLFSLVPTNKSLFYLPIITHRITNLWKFL